MTHDPLCPKYIYDMPCCCNLILRVRFQERGMCARLHGTPAEDFAHVREAIANVIGTVDGVTEDEITEFLEKL